MSDKIKPLFRGRIPRMQGRANTSAPVTQGELEKVVRAIELATTDNGIGSLTDVDLDTTAPADGDVLTYDEASESWVPAAVAGGSGGDIETDGFLGRARAWSKARGYSNARDDYGCAAPSVFGTGPTSTTAGSTLLNSYPHHTYVAADAAGFSAGLGWASNSGFAIGSVSGAGGFRVRMRFSLNTAAGTTRRYFFGVSTMFGTQLGSANPSSKTNIIGFGKDSGSGDSNWRLMHNDASGTATQTDTGVAASTSVLYEIEIWVEPNDTTVNARLMSVTGSGRTILYSAAITTNLPANTTVLSPHMDFNTGTGTTGVTMGYYFCEVMHTGAYAAA
jgi:hypothetical protein